ncbi:thiol-disulfide isomerase [Agromyces rhizosphaerae]|uniref:Thiol-disulfide isomerase n=1 Tax=Agromyces rhizosphaerae TaxID=88374 RepID=A0A9W6CX66_9MICO|nr:TlpA disulfide reductase family protein [Agromyces rhizosphaerae]GLI26872.1 thiol-disulfide isomerase [Agromyces rhizosphaerae]
MRRLAAVALAAASVVVLAGCGSDPLADQYRDGSGKNYIAGDGTISEIAPADRGEPIAFAGESIEGEQVSSADYAGEVLIVNFWYAGCAPCRAEAPDLQAVSEEFAGAGASVLGVNVRDQAPTAASFESDYGITYPSIVDANDGAVQLAFAGDVPPNAVPTTLVLDAEGRVAARILGQLNRSNLQTIVNDVLDEGA